MMKTKNRPPFPLDVATAKLSMIHLASISDPHEVKRLFEACSTFGVFQLNLFGTEQGRCLLKQSKNLFDLSEAVFGLDLATKQSHSMDPQTAYGYKALGASQVDEKGTPDCCEFWGFGKDRLINDREGGLPAGVEMYEKTTRSFVRACHAVCMIILKALEKHIGLQPGVMLKLHDLRERSTDQLRLLKMPAQPQSEHISLLAHTDYGSITLVWNTLGGLQIFDDTSGSWQFVKPISGSVTVNIGDALEKLTGGALRSKIHRVVAPPGAQASFDRYSIAYFCRPLDDVLMRALPLPGSIPQEPVEGEQAYKMADWVALRTQSFRRLPTAELEEDA